MKKFIVVPPGSNQHPLCTQEEAEMNLGAEVDLQKLVICDTLGQARKIISEQSNLWFSPKNLHWNDEDNRLSDLCVADDISEPFQLSCIAECSEQEVEEKKFLSNLAIWEVVIAEVA